MLFPKKYTIKQIKSFSAQYQKANPSQSKPLLPLLIPSSHKLQVNNVYEYFLHDFFAKSSPAFLLQQNWTYLTYEAQQLFSKKNKTLQQIWTKKLELFIHSKQQKNIKANQKILSTYFTNSPITDLSYSDQYIGYIKDQLLSLKKSWKLYSKKSIAHWSLSLNTSVPPSQIQRVEEQKPCYTLTYFVETKNHTLHIPVFEPDLIFWDVALLVHPQDKRYKKLIWKNVLIPIVNRPIPIIWDSTVNITKNNGIKRVNPASDSDSILIAQKYNLPLDHFVFDRNWTYTDYAGIYAWKPRQEFAENVLQNLEDFLHFVQHKDISLETVQIPYCIYNKEPLTQLQVDQRTIDIDSYRATLEQDIKSWEIFPDIKDDLLSILPQIQIVFNTQIHTGIPLTFLSTGSPDSLNPEILTCMYHIFLLANKKQVSTVIILENNKYESLLQMLLLEQVFMQKYHYQTVNTYLPVIANQNIPIFKLIDQFWLDAIRLSLLVHRDANPESIRLFDNFLHKLRNGVRFFALFSHTETLSRTKAIKILEQKGEKADFWILSELEDLRIEYQSLTDYQSNLVFFQSLYIFIHNKLLTWYLELQKLQSSKALYATLFIVYKKVLCMLHHIIPDYAQALCFLSNLTLEAENLPVAVIQKTTNNVLLYNIFDQLSSFKSQLNILKHQHISAFVKADTHSLEIIDSHQNIFANLLKIDDLQLLRIHQSDIPDYNIHLRENITFWIKIIEIKKQIDEPELKDLEQDYQSLLENKEIIRSYITNSINMWISDSPTLDTKKQELEQLQARIDSLHLQIQKKKLK